MARKRAGLTIPELLVAVAVMAVLLVMGGLALLQSNKVWLSTSGHDAAMRELIKARASLQRDLELSHPGTQTFSQSTVDGSLAAGGRDGDAVNFLSPLDADGQSIYGNDGAVFWMRNITYYMTTPLDHDSLFGLHCTGHADASGYDDACPHKILVRKISDQPPTTDPNDPTTRETLLPVLGPFPRPTGFPQTTDLKTVAVNLLTFRCTARAGSYSFDVRAVSLADARRSLEIGSASLGEGKFTLQEVFSVYPKN